MKELQDVVNPIMTRMYQESGGGSASDVDPKKMASGKDGMATEGASVEEVD